ncbi:MAG: DUF2177 family protein [Saprospiraceae bacterium]|nr:DUF2177 family protein [Saprospiraceae bacterium]
MYYKLYLIALPVFFAIDLLWLGLIAKNFYNQQIGHLMRPQVNWTAAILFYLIFLAGMVIFVIAPAHIKGSWHNALCFGIIFGLITYATYDLTNLATLKGWPLRVVIVDLIWGMVLSGSVSIITWWIARKLGV